MPYIKRYRRDELQCDAAANHGAWAPQNAGELNYVFSVIARDYFRARRNYAAINDIVGALEGAKMEFYRRVATGYEDIKIVENGDVYPAPPPADIKTIPGSTE